MSAFRRDQSSDEESGDSWLITYADAITLLLAFFVMLVTVSKIDIPAFEEVQASIAEDLGQRVVVRPTTLLKSQMAQVIDSLGVADAVRVDTDADGVVLEFAASAFYRSGSAQIRADARPVLETLARTLMSPRYSRFKVSIEGHTDDTPIKTALFASNWELSASRATNVVRLFIAEGLPPRRLRAVGYADTQPKVPNRNAVGAPLRQNQAINRRIIARIHRQRTIGSAWIAPHASAPVPIPRPRPTL